ncbi:hypothetical protein GGX14DRAFT_601070 [Mycena pura]|uniref:Uncharacterized protein n=1 Tax=Mycena pura TaxID=153505 RepID=A0AAD6US77_9AGAR|nr:hypothetical protein GGX14DRAFT_601070 [Mycena pura]
MSQESPLLRVPQEIWLHIHQLATINWSPLALAYSERFHYWPLRVLDPFMEIRELLRNASSFALVSRLWNALANEILFENIRVDSRFHSLYDALNRRGAAHLVRSIRLSSTRFDYDHAILACCPGVQLIVLPDSPEHAAPLQVPNHLGLDSVTQLLSLKRIYWTETRHASGLLRKLVPIAPNLEHIFLSQSNYPTQRTLEALSLPQIPSLRGLGVGDHSLGTILQIDLQNLTLLHCTPLFLTHPDFPASLPRVTVLRIFGSRSHIHFGTVFAQFPRLQELNYDVWNSLSPPTGGEPVPLSLIHLHSAVTVVRDWIPIEDHFTLLSSSTFPAVQRIVLYGTWYRVVANPRFSHFRSALRARGCQLEFPEGHVLSP